MKQIREMPLFLLAMALMIAGGALLLALPPRAFSGLENRPLAVWKSGSLLENGFDERTETYLSDHFPGRDGLVQLDAAVSVLTGQRLQDGVLCGRAGFLLEEPVREVTQTARSAMETLEEIAGALELPVSLMLIPTSAQVLPEYLPALYDAGDQLRVMEELSAGATGVRAVDSGLMQAADPQGLYYRMDHHLTAQGAWTVYSALCSEWGLTPRSAPRTQIGAFRGSYYARVPDPGLPAEVFTADVPQGLTLTVDGVERPILAAGDQLGRNKYAALIGETYAHACITGGEGEEALLVLCDSYANAVVPLLAQHFRRVDMIDPRYYPGVLTDLVAEAGSTRVLALYGLNTFSTNRGLALLTIGGE